MGLTCTRPDAKSVTKFPCKVLLVGNSDAGKTSLLYGWKIGCKNLVNPRKTDGFNVEQITHNGQIYIVWDLSGDPNYHARWRQFYHGTDVLVIVIDSSSEESVEFVSNLLQDRDLKDIPCIIVFNKVDLTGKKIKVFKETAGIPNSPNVFTVSCCAKDDNSIKTVLDMIHQAHHKTLDNQSDTL